MIGLAVVLNHSGVIHLLIYFLFQKKIPSCCLSETSQSLNYCLKTFLSHTSMDRQSKQMALVMVYFGISYDRMPLMFAITRRNCHQYAANLIFVRYITCDNLEQSRIQFLFYIKLIVNNSGFLYCGGNKFQLMLILPDEFNKRTEF